MTVSRARQLCLEQTRYYHCISRCVRRAFLCGKDRYSGRDYSHRRAWIERRIAELASVFAIDVLAYAVMSNHFHVVVRIDDSRPAEWTDEEVVERWSRLFCVSDKATSRESIQVWRNRLSSISWYMRSINEPLARLANREDDCVGRFWQGRFKLQALLDDSAVLKCMAYVDLNPVRSGLAKDPQTASFTSAKARHAGADKCLAQFKDQDSGETDTLWLSKREYLDLLDWTAHAIRNGRLSVASKPTPPALVSVKLPDTVWLREIQSYGRWYFRAVGSLAALDRYRCRVGVRWLKGIRRAREFDLRPTSA